MRIETCHVNLFCCDTQFSMNRPLKYLQKRNGYIFIVVTCWVTCELKIWFLSNFKSEFLDKNCSLAEQFLNYFYFFWLWEKIFSDRFKNICETKFNCLWILLSSYTTPRSVLCSVNVYSLFASYSTLTKCPTILM